MGLQSVCKALMVISLCCFHEVTAQHRLVDVKPGDRAPLRLFPAFPPVVAASGETDGSQGPGDNTYVALIGSTVVRTVSCLLKVHAADESQTIQVWGPQKFRLGASVASLASVFRSSYIGEIMAEHRADCG